MNIILVGFKNSGKTTIGKKLSIATRRKFIDTDNLITKRYKVIYGCELPINKIYKNLGESEFRKMESAVIKKLKLINDSIIATGGGVVLDPYNLIILKSIGSIFFLDVSLLNATERIYENKVAGNLFLGIKKTKQDIARVFESRQGIYQSIADFIIKVDNLNEEMVVNKIIKLWQVTV